MQDEEHSAHQFSVRDMSIQADDEEREELAMLVNAYEKEEEEELKSVNKSSGHNQTVFSNSTKNRMFSSKRSTSKTHKSIVTLTHLEKSRKSKGRELGSSSLMSPKKSTTEIAIQTEGLVESKSKKTVRVINQDGQ